MIHNSEKLSVALQAQNDHCSEFVHQRFHLMVNDPLYWEWEINENNTLESFLIFCEPIIRYQPIICTARTNTRFFLFPIPPCEAERIILE